MMENGKFIRHGDFEEVFDTNDETIRGFFDYNFIQ
jgi:phospholipid/cholesterol/gamma-HCH transport system ATP-binding protein